MQGFLPYMANLFCAVDDLGWSGRLARLGARLVALVALRCVIGTTNVISPSLCVAFLRIASRSDSLLWDEAVLLDASALWVELLFGIQVLGCFLSSSRGAVQLAPHLQVLTPVDCQASFATSSACGSQRLMLPA